MSLSSALIATIALLIIVVVVTVVVVVVVVAVVVVVVVIVVVGICRPASTVSGQMANPLAVIAPRWTRTFMIVITLGTVEVLIVLGKIIHSFFSFCLTLA
ncbi:hypothetical protein Tco_1407344 [Tanacetum coccineum]